MVPSFWTYLRSPYLLSTPLTHACSSKDVTYLKQISSSMHACILHLADTVDSGMFYIMFSDFYSFAGRIVYIFHKYWGKKAIT